jgi:exosortase
VKRSKSGTRVRGGNIAITRGKRPTIAAASPSPIPELPVAGLRAGPKTVVLAVAFAVVVVWSYWPVFAGMVEKWAADPQYSHSYLVPLFSLYLLWYGRALAAPAASGPSWWGIPVIAVGVLSRLAGAYVYFDWLEAMSLLPILAGAALLLGGWWALRWSWPAIAFLAFMVPLPFSVETALSQPLQRVATQVSTYVLQLLGRPAFAEGNVIVVGEARIGVVEACNGLGMMLLFFALSAAVAILSRRSVVERILVVASAVPVAVAANVARVTVTSFIYDTLGSRWADVVFHDLAGWLMMPLALGMLWLELWVLGRLFLDAAGPTRPVVTLRSRRTSPTTPAPSSTGPLPLAQAARST